MDINQRYDVIGERLSDRRGETRDTLGKVRPPWLGHMEPRDQVTWSLGRSS